MSTPARLVLSVATGGRTAQPTAAALLFASTEDEPTFRYQRGKAVCEEPLLRTPQRIPSALQEPVRRYLQRAALGWAVIHDPHPCRTCGKPYRSHDATSCRFTTDKDARTTLLARAVTRSLERWVHVHAPPRTFRKEDLVILLEEGYTLPPIIVPEAIPRRVVRVEDDWRLSAAAFLARGGRHAAD